MNSKSYTIEEILNAVNDLQKSKKNVEMSQIELNHLKKDVTTKLDIPNNTLRLIEQAEKKIKSKN